MTASVLIYATRFCPYCIMARRLLDKKGVRYREIRVDSEPELRQAMESCSGRHSVPQIYIGDTHVGGYDELHALEKSGLLDALIQGQ